MTAVKFRRMKIDNLKLKNTVAKVNWSIARTVILLAVQFIVVYPLLRIVVQAFRPIEEFRNPAIIWITVNPTLDNVRLSWQMMGYPRAFANTFRLSVGSALLQLVTCSLAGYAFAKFDFKFKKLFFAFVMLTMVIPSQMLFLPMYLQYAFFDFFGLSRVVAAITGNSFTNYTINLLNSPLTFFIPSAFGVGLRSGLFIFIFRQYFKGVPDELLEAAKADGCGAFKTFIWLMVPIAKATFATVLLFSIVWHWNETTMTSLFFLRSEARPLATVLGFLMDSMRFSELIIHEGYNVAQGRVVAFSGTLLYITPLIILYLFTQRFFVEGVETTGIKG